MAKEQLCWLCTKACGGCAWSDSLRRFSGQTVDKDGFITACTEFLPDIRAIVYEAKDSQVATYLGKSIRTVTRNKKRCREVFKEKLLLDVNRGMQLIKQMYLSWTENEDNIMNV